LDSSTVITPSLPTSSIACDINFPISSSPAEIDAICAISSDVSTFFVMFLSSSTAVSTAFWIPFLRIIGLAPAATFLSPSLIIACANNVAVVVPSPATSLVFVATSLTNCAPMFSYGSDNSISLAIVTPSFVICGEPNDLFKTTFLPFGPNVTFTVSAKALTPLSIERRASSSNLIIFAIISTSPFLFNNC